MSESEWQALPVMLRVDDVAKVLGTRPRWVSDHAEELGGRLFADRWMFPKGAIAEILGIR